MTYKCEFHSEVEKDYSEAYEWYESQKKGLGERFLSFVRKKVGQIAEHPEHYGVRTRKDHREVQLDIFPYLIVYKIYKRSEAILIISIHNTRKHPRKKYRK
jgi:mRNA-degrading endonuclease RelE of RelBE toxin-antitoxin system